MKLFIEKSVKNEEITQNALAKFKADPIYINSLKEVPTNGPLIIAEQKGNFIKECPCTPHHLPCGYHVINTAVGCPLDCTYCYLHQYSNLPGTVIYANIEKLFAELDKLLSNGNFYRLGNGEFSDSLVFEPKLGLAEKLVQYFAQKEKVLFELKTKTTNIDHLLSLDHNNKTVIGWSLNPNKIIKTDEKKSPLLEERLKAAQKCINAGYKISFHFDPLIYFDKWEEEYEKVVNLLFEYVPANKIAYISLGTLRFNHELKPVIEKKFPQSRLLLAEFITGEDGKTRYFKPIRIKMYKKLLEYIRKYNQEDNVYLCMERADVWAKVELDYQRILQRVNE